METKTGFNKFKPKENFLLDAISSLGLHINVFLLIKLFEMRVMAFLCVVTTIS